MSFKYREPDQCDYNTEEEYKEAMAAFIDAESRAIEAAREEYYEAKYGG